MSLFLYEERTVDFLYCIQMYLPVKDRNGCPVDTKIFDQVADQIVKRFGGITMTSFWGNPVYDGFWKSPETKRIVRDKTSIFTVLVPENPESREFFLHNKKKWEQDLNYEELLITVHQIQYL